MNKTQIEILDRASKQERARQSQAPPRVQVDAFPEKIRATRAAVKDQEAKDAFQAAVTDQEAKQLRVEVTKKSVDKFIPAKLEEAPVRITTTSGRAGALSELLRQSQAPPRVPEAPMPTAARTRAGQAAATKLSQGPASNTRSQANCALERALHAASNNVHNRTVS